MNLKLLKVARFFHLINKKNYNEKRQIEIVKNSPLFDAKWYLAQNPDVKAKKIGAAKHYVKYGWKEGRNPSPDFDTEEYLAEYPELEEKSWCPLFHYMLEHKELMPKIDYKVFWNTYYQKYIINTINYTKQQRFKIEEILGKYKGKDINYKIIAQSKYFNKRWYLKTNPDIKQSGIDPIEHYIKYGWKEGRNPSKYFDGNRYLDKHQDVKKAKMNPLIHYEFYGRGENRRVFKPRSNDNLDFFYFTRYVEKMNSDKQSFCEYRENNRKKINTIKPIAFYLPQFHSFKENDTWYGRGFTEWTNVTKSIPMYTGHYQPHLPIDVGFYNLNTTDVFYRQIELAQNYGIYGFAFYYYWFSGRKLMEKPLNNYLLDSNLKFPFCLCWACENWSKLWDGGNKELLVESHLATDDANLFWNDILPFLKDERYIKHDNKPVILMYRPNKFDKGILKEFLKKIRKYAQRDGFEGLYLLWVITNDITSENLFIEDEYGFDGLVEFPPHGLRKNINKKKNVPIKELKGYLNSSLVGEVYDMEQYIGNNMHKLPLFNDINIYRGIFPMWDNSSRKAQSGCLIFEGMSPFLYSKWLTDIVQWTKRNHVVGDRYIFINAWNEWAEGAHLEPDNKYGYAYLQTTKDVLESNDD